MVKEEENETFSSTAEVNLFMVELGGNVRMNIKKKMLTMNAPSSDK